MGELRKLRTFEVTTQETATAQYLVAAADETEARQRFENGEFITHKQVDAVIDEILSVEEVK